MTRLQALFVSVICFLIVCLAGCGTVECDECNEEREPTEDIVYGHGGPYEGLLPDCPEEVHEVEECVPHEVYSGYFADPVAWVMQELEINFVSSGLTPSGMMEMVYELTAPSPCSDLAIDYMSFVVDSDVPVGEWAHGSTMYLGIGDEWYPSETYSPRITPLGTQAFFDWASYEEGPATKIDLVVHGGERVTFRLQWSLGAVPEGAEVQIRMSTLVYEDTVVENSIQRDNPVDASTVIHL